MPFCPICRTEYNPDAIRCADCNVVLVEELPENTSVTHVEFSKDNWLEIARLTSKSYAEMVLEVWRDNNVRGVVQSQAGFFGYTGQMGLTSFQPVGGVYSMWVHQDDIVDADTLAAGILGDSWQNSKTVDIEEL